MMSTNFSEFLTHSLPCPHLDLSYTIKFTQPFLRLLFHDPLPLPPPMHTSYLETPQDTAAEGDTILDTVYEYDAPGDSWKLLPENMTYARYGATAITVPTTVFPDCE